MSMKKASIIVALSIAILLLFPVNTVFAKDIIKYEISTCSLGVTCTPVGDPYYVVENEEYILVQKYICVRSDGSYYYTVRRIVEPLGAPRA